MEVDGANGKVTVYLSLPFSSSGQIADRVNLRYFLTVGMIGMHYSCVLHVQYTCVVVLLLQCTHFYACKMY